MVVTSLFDGPPPAEKWDTAQFFAVRTGAATPKGLGLDSEKFGGTLKAGGEDDNKPVQHGIAGRNGVTG